MRVPTGNNSDDAIEDRIPDSNGTNANWEGRKVSWENDEGSDEDLFEHVANQIRD